MEITDEDIRIAETIILPPGLNFNDERKAFIKSTESRDVLACPGSGKTTALLAKLYILARKMPFADGRGICVLTHTNVAIDEIRSKVGAAANILFQYPNFFGTIQSFVNHFLAIPAYKEEFRRDVLSIDFDHYSNILQSRCKRKTLFYLQKKNKTIDDLSNYWFDPDNLSIVTSYKDRSIPLGLSTTTPTYQDILQLRVSILKEGYLSFNDAYVFAFRRIQKHPLLKKLFAQRFCFCFIDEAQDTNDFQRDILAKIFPQCGQSTVLQKLGDNNQAIYSGFVESDNFWIPYGNPPFHFSDTLRFGKTIVDLLKTIRADNQILLEAHPTRESLSPILLVFKDGEHTKVLKAFSELINTHRDKWTSIEKPIYKAIGWVGRDKTNEDKYCIPKYYPDFNPSAKSITPCHPSLLSFVKYLHLFPGTPRIQKNILLDAIVEVLYLEQKKHPITGKYFTKASFIAYAKEHYSTYYDTFMIILGRWLWQLQNEKINAVSFRNKLCCLIKKYILYSGISAKARRFLYSDDVLIPCIPDDNTTPNEWESPYGDIIQISTVHGVKGETHTATLYLESSYYGLETKRLLPCMKGTFPKKLGTRLIENLKIAHVGLSRATHLVVFACNEEHIAGEETALMDNGWEIHKAT